MHPWHDVDLNNGLVGIVEMPYWTDNKYELCKETGLIKFDRKINQFIPETYGFIPQTLSEDGDPLDVFIISQDTFHPLVQVPIDLVALIRVVDNGQKDYKLIAKPKKTKLTVGELAEKMSTLKKFLLTYKKGMVFKSYGDWDDAQEVLKKSHERYLKWIL